MRTAAPAHIAGAGEFIALIEAINEILEQLLQDLAPIFMERFPQTQLHHRQIGQPLLPGMSYKLLEKGLALLLFGLAGLRCGFF